MQTDAGIYISFDGPPRSGRTHQADALAASLSADGHDVLRVSMPPDDVPIAKTTMAWLDGRLAAYRALVDAEIAPALAAGRVVILDGGVTSILLRARAVLGTSAPLGMLYLLDARAMHPVEVDMEWIITAPREGERKVPGFDCISFWQDAASSTPPHSRITHTPAAGARRHVTYFVDPRAIAKSSETILAAFAACFAERVAPEWAEAVAETRAARDVAFATERMAQWAEEFRRVAVDRRRDPKTAAEPRSMPLYGATANWGAYDEATRLAIVRAIPPVEGAAGRFVTALAAGGYVAPEGAVGEALGRAGTMGALASLDAVAG